MLADYLKYNKIGSLFSVNRLRCELIAKIIESRQSGFISERQNLNLSDWLHKFTSWDQWDWINVGRLHKLKKIEVYFQ